MVLTLLAYMIGLWYGYSKWRQLGGDRQKAFIFFALCAMATRIGGRLMTVFENPGLYLSNPLSIFKLWEPGFGSLGSWVAAIVVAAWYLRHNAMELGKIFDQIVIPVGMLGHGIGRLGCFMAGDVYGRVTSLPVGIVFSNTDSSIPRVFLGVPLHPLPLYFSFTLLTLFALSLILNKHKLPDGQVATIVLLLYATIRFLLEYLRSLYDPLPKFLGLNSCQMVCSIIGIGAVLSWLKSQYDARI